MMMTALRLLGGSGDAVAQRGAPAVSASAAPSGARHRDDNVLGS
jgi:hypothetical protein